MNTRLIVADNMIWLSFIKLEFCRIGADSAITPREVIRDLY